MKVRTIDAGDEGAWLAALGRLPQSDVYFLPGYHRVCAGAQGGTALAFTAERGKDLLFHPFLMRPIEGRLSATGGAPLHDIESVNGYSGPLSTSGDPAFLAQAWEQFDARRG